MLDGFTVSHFRNFAEEPQAVKPLARINIFIGSNNSGKSNVLRFVERVLSPLLTPGRSSAIKLTRADAPRQGGSATHHVVFATVEGMIASLQNSVSAWQPRWSEELRKHGDQDGLLALPISSQSVTAGHYFARESPLPDNLNPGYWQAMWRALTGASSSGDLPRHWYPGVMDKLIQHVMQSVEPYYIPSFRQIPTRLPEDFGSEYTHAVSESRHIIDDLAELALPAWDEQHKRESFEKLRSFIGQVIDDPDVAIEIPADRTTINVNTGGTFLPIEALGSGVHEVVILAAEIVLRRNSTILLEEPEIHLHPNLQRRFMQFLVEETENQIFITTHSAGIIDTPQARVFGVDNVPPARVSPLVTSQDKFRACREMGYKASDLLQSNSIIWVEGPSDRIYVRQWIKDAAPELVEGVHYSIMFYGGKLLSALSAVDDAAFTDFISILPINRHPAVIMDSDLGWSAQSLRGTKQRVIDELKSVRGISWVTAGREIESYYDYSSRNAAVRAVHRKARALSGGKNRYAKPLNFIDDGGQTVTKGFDKIAIANYLVQSVGSPNSFDFSERIAQLVAFIRVAN